MANVIDYPDNSDNSGAVVLIDDGTQLEVLAGTATQSGVISQSGGTHSLEKIGGGALILTSDSTFTGDTTITSGTLQLGDGGSTGSLASTNIIDNGALVVDRSGAAFVLGNISGSGTFTKEGSNTVSILNLGTTGLVTISEGTLVSQSGGVITADFLDNGILILSSVFSVPLYTGSISGTGGVTVVTTAGIILSGNNTYSGATLIKAGAINADTNSSFSANSDYTVESGGLLSAKGNLVTLGSLAGAGNLFADSGGGFRIGADNKDTNYSGIYYDDVFGPASLEKIGLGTLTLSGGLNSYRGPTVITAGTLNVTGMIASSSVGIASGGTLNGTGTTGSVNAASGGTLSAGAGMGVGTLTIQGDLTLASGSIYREDVSGTSADRIVVAGAANIDGHLIENFAGAIYALGTRYTLISSTGALTGTFDSIDITGLPSGLRADVTYDSHNAYLTIETAHQQSDVNGDAKSDIIYQNDNGQAAVWLMSGLTVLGGSAVGNPGISWHAKASGDFNGDGKADILYQNNDGSAAIWLMDGLNVLSGSAVGNPGASWHVKASGDFNGDEKSDILYQNNNGQAAIWLMDGLNVLSGSAVGDPGTAWHAAASGDFNGDGKADILYQNDDGQAAIWLMDGLNVLGGSAVGNPGASWHVAAAGDYNGDGKSDILYQNDSGQVAIWEMDGLSVLGGSAVGNPGPSWHAKVGGDYNADGKSDILFQNNSGETAVWLMSGLNVLSGSGVGNPGASWHVATAFR